MYHPGLTKTYSFITEHSYHSHFTGVEIIWAIKDKHMSATFIDPGAAEFLQPELTKEKVEASAPSKRARYTVEKLEVFI